MVDMNISNGMELNGLQVILGLEMDNGNMSVVTGEQDKKVLYGSKIYKRSTRTDY